MKYHYDETVDEFVPGEADGGNTVTVTVSGETVTPRFAVQIDDFGYVLAAFNRLVVRHVPTFEFPAVQP